MDIYQVIKKDHEEVKGVLSMIEKEKDENEREDLLNEVHNLFLTHAKAEEKLFYPALEDHEQIRTKVLEAYEEHNIVKSLLKEFSRVKDSDHWMAKFSVCQELIKQHIKEEESEVFRAAKGILDKNEAQELGEKFEKEKEKAMAASH